MPDATQIAFAIFMACCIAHFPLIQSVRSKLVERHPGVWAKISKVSWFHVDGAVVQFARSGACSDLADAELSRAAARLKWVNTIGISSLAVFAVSMFFNPPR